MVATVAAAIATRPHPQPIAPKLHASPCLQSLRPPTDAHSAADVHVCSSMLVTHLRPGIPTCARDDPRDESSRRQGKPHRLSPPSLDHHVDVHQHCRRQRELGCTAVVAMAKRYEATRKQAQGDEPRKSAGARARAAAASAQPQSEARAKSPQGHPAPRCAVQAARAL